MTSKQLSFGVERDVLVDELQYYFESAMAADIPQEELEEANGLTGRDKANFMLRRLENYGWIYVKRQGFLLKHIIWIVTPINNILHGAEN